MSIDPVRRSIVVEVPQARAFALFTGSFGAWWPHSHHIGKAPMRSGMIEPRAGGRWYEVGDDDSECDWGKVLVFEPPERLVLGWQISPDFTYDPSITTEVELRFIAETPSRTRVELEHRDLEKFGDRAAAMSAAVDGPNGWPGLLQSFVTFTTPWIPGDAS